MQHCDHSGAKEPCSLEKLINADSPSLYSSKAASTDYVVPGRRKPKEGITARKALYTIQLRTEFFALFSATFMPSCSLVRKVIKSKLILIITGHKVHVFCMIPNMGLSEFSFSIVMSKSEPTICCLQLK